MIRFLSQTSILACLFVWSFLYIVKDPQGPSANVSVPEKLRAGHAYKAAKWMNDQRAYPYASIPRDWREKAERLLEGDGVAKGASSSLLAWQSLGPNNSGGRVRSILVHPSDPNIMYAGSVSGGIFKSVDGGSSWFPVTDGEQNLVIGTMVMDATNPNIIYAGTGEGYFNFDYLRGDGVLKTTDGGASWTLLKNFASAGPPYYHHFINKLVIRPDDPQMLFAAMLGGIWKTTNGGSSWSKITFSTRSSFCMDLVIDPSNPTTMFATFGLFSSDGIYRTTNGGTNWSRLSGGFPSSGFGRISLAIAQSNPSVLYASVSDTVNYYTHSIQKSTNSGANWTTVAVPFDNAQLVNGTHLGGQGWYDNVIAVHPENQDVVYAGGINLFRSVNGGNSWGRISNGYGSPYVHVDQHAITFHPTNRNIIYFGNDGGVFKTTDGGSSFSSLNADFVTTQFYSGAVHPSSDFYLGGTQDNGVLRSTGTVAWTQVIGGDGGPVHINPNTPTVMYGSYIYSMIYRSTNSGNAWSRIMNGIPTSAEGWAADRCNFIAPYVMDPSNPSILLAGTYRIFRTSDGGSSWSAVSQDLTGDGAGSVGSEGSVISAIAVAPSNSNIVFVGTSGSGTASPQIRYSTSGAQNINGSWFQATRTNLPQRYITSLAIDPANDQRVFVTYSGYERSASPPYRHVYVTVNRGVAWVDVSGNLPDVPVNTVVIDPANSNHIVVGTDVGIFESTVGGTTWTRSNTGMANVSVTDLDIRVTDNVLVAATHGRGMFKSTGPLSVLDDSEQPTRFKLMQNFPNPFNPSTEIRFVVKTGGRVRLTVYDIAGREVAELLDEDRPAGTHSVRWNAERLASGVYLCRMENAALTGTIRMVLVR